MRNGYIVKYQVWYKQPSADASVHGTYDTLELANESQAFVSSEYGYEAWIATVEVPFVKNAKVEYGNMIQVNTVKGEFRVIFQADGSFRIITDLPCIQVNDVLKLEGNDLGKYAKIVRVENFGHPFED